MPGRSGSRSNRKRWPLGLALWSLVGLVALGTQAVANELRERGRRRKTRSALCEIALAAQRYFVDVGSLPASPGQLDRDPGPTVPGWSGPYLGQQAELFLDAWSCPIQWFVSNDLLSLRSAGSDARFGDAGDVTVLLHADRIRAQITLERLRRLNEGIVIYNAAFQFTEPLVPDCETLVRQLADKGLVGKGEDLTRDAWGLPFVADPAGLAPVVRMRSVRL